MNDDPSWILVFLLVMLIVAFAMRSQGGRERGEIRMKDVTPPPHPDGGDFPKSRPESSGVRRGPRAVVGGLIPPRRKRPPASLPAPLRPRPDAAPAPAPEAQGEAPAVEPEPALPAVPVQPPSRPNEGNAPSRRERLKRLIPTRGKSRSEIRNELDEERRRHTIKTPPPMIGSAIFEFKWERKKGKARLARVFSNVSDFDNMADESPLVRYGYHVGKNGRSELERRLILEFAFDGEIPVDFPPEYRDSWGEPGTSKRYSRIVNHLTMLIDHRFWQPSMDIAVKQWSQDLAWFKRRFGERADRYRQYGL